MCISDGKSFRIAAGSSRNPLQSQKNRKSESHHCALKTLACSSHRLCLFCVLLANFAAMTNGQNFSTVIVSPTILPVPVNEAGMESNAGNQPNTSSERNRVTTTAPAPETTALESLPGLVKCDEDGCYIKISSSKQALEKLADVSEQLFSNYATKNGSETFVNGKGLEDLMKDIGHMKDDHEDDDHHGHSHEGHDHDHDDENHDDHDHGSHEDHDHGSHEGHDHGSHEGHDHESLDVDAWDDFFNYDDYEEDVTCYSSVEDLVNAYFYPKTSDTIQLTFGDFMTLMPQILMDIPRPGCGTEEETDSETHEHGTEKTSIEHSTANIWLISFSSVLVISLVSLLGVLVIPLLKRSAILNQLISFLVALAVGTLAGDALLHLLPHASGLHDHSAHGGHEGHDHGGHNHGGEEDDHFAAMWKGLVACFGIYAFYLLETVMGFVRRHKSGTKKLSKANSCQADSPTSSSSSSSRENFKGSGDAGPNASLVPLVTVIGHRCEHNDREDQPREHRVDIDEDEEPVNTGHHHHLHEVPDGIASLAWMVIVGDGLHNMTDGLAIGAAFSSSIGTGLSTVLAIFFHEIPQELGDFAILLNAGMSVKQALLWNFISACMCFVGLVIGLLVGEFTNGMILWILAFTAGGFLYIALVDMFPAMIKQLDHKDYIKRFVVQNIGILTGFAIMTIIALREDALLQSF